MSTRGGWHAGAGGVWAWLAAVCAAGAAAETVAAAVIDDPEIAAVGAVDLRPALMAWGLPARAQGARGTCSVFVVTQAIEYAAASTGRTPERLSVEYLNWASNRVVGEEADGGFFSDLWRGFTALGVCGEGELAYRDAFDPGLVPGDGVVARAAELKGAGLRLHWIKEWDVTTGLSAPQLEMIRETLRRQWPVCGGFRWPKAERWEGGMLNMPPAEGVRDGHSVLLVGYRDDPTLPGGGAFVFRNSAHGARDGEMSYAYAGAYMNDAAWIDAGSGETARTREGVNTDLLGALAGAPHGQSRRVSSNMRPDWHTENLDMTWLQPGESVEMPLLEGPGVITHMWFTSHAGWVGELNALSLRIFWDGRSEAGVEVPLGDFFAVGQGRPAPVESIPVQVSSTGSLSCSWRMPFARSARVVVTNDNPDRGAGLYWQVDWTRLDSLAPGTPYFNARYRREYPAVGGRDYSIAAIEGRGLYVGTVLSVTSAQDGWFGEGDDFFYVDGEQVPGLQGTGTEDYFNDAWGFRARTGPWCGTPRWQGDAAGDSGVCYRWHVPDPVWFERSLRVEIEHKGNRPDDTEGFFLERPDFLSSVAFWYQTGEPARWDPLPAWNERRVPWEHRHFVPSLGRVKAPAGTTVKVDTSGLFGARPVLLWTASVSGSMLNVPFEVKREGRYAVRLSAGTGPDGGAFDIEIDGRKVGAPDFRSAEAGEADVSLGVCELGAGEHTVGFRATTSSRGSLSVEMLRLLRLPPEARREVKTHHEAHFVRLGIGRAVYAYRLAFGVVPESLAAMVEAGVMSERYLRDENNVPLVSRRDGGFLLVESTSGETWSKRWSGLDPRR